MPPKQPSRCRDFPRTCREKLWGRIPTAMQCAVNSPRNLHENCADLTQYQIAARHEFDVGGWHSADGGRTPRRRYEQAAQRRRTGTSGHHHRGGDVPLSLIHISEPTRLLSISYAVFCLKKKK